VVNLRRNVPLEKFKETAILVAPEIIILAAQQLTTAATLEEIAREFVGTNIPVAYSGRIFQSTPETKDYIHGHFLGTEMTSTFAVIENLFKEDAPSAYALPENKFEELYASFSLHQVSIHAAFTEKIATKNIPMKELADPITYLNKNIAAALYLGSLDLLAPELEWVKHLLKHREIKEAYLGYYLEYYSETVTETIGDAAEPLVSWLVQQAVQYKME
jgi:hypothetical protein